MGHDGSWCLVPCISGPGSFSMAFLVSGLLESHTLYFSRSSLLRGALMMVRRTLEGAEKCALRDFLLEEDRAVVTASVLLSQPYRSTRHTGVDLGHFGGVGRIVVIKSRRWSSKCWRKRESLQNSSNQVCCGVTRA